MEWLEKLKGKRIFNPTDSITLGVIIIFDSNRVINSSWGKDPEQNVIPRQSIKWHLPLFSVSRLYYKEGPESFGMEYTKAFED